MTDIFPDEWSPLAEEAARYKAEKIRGIQGIRWWQVAIDRETVEPILVSGYRVEHAWREPVLKADRSPWESAFSNVPSHGIYVVKPDTALALKYYQDTHKDAVMGTVEILGETVEHEFGWRTSKVIISQLALPRCQSHFDLTGRDQRCSKPAEYLTFDLRGQTARVTVFPSPSWDKGPLPGPCGFPAHLLASSMWSCEHHGPRYEDGVNVSRLVELWEARYRCEITTDPYEVLKIGSDS